MTSPARTMAPDDRAAVKYLTRWHNTVRQASDAVWLDAAWRNPLEERRRAAVNFPAGVLEELTSLVQSRIDQLSRLDSEVRT